MEASLGVSKVERMMMRMRSLLKVDKGAPARESRTGTWLVSPALGYEKKNEHL